MSILGNPVTLCPALFAVTLLPEDMTHAAGDTAVFRVRAVGPAAAGAAYQWIYRTTPTGAWTDVTAESGKTDTYVLTVRTRHNGYQYKCAVTCANGLKLETNVVTMTVAGG